MSSPAREPASCTTRTKAARSSSDRYCMTIEWKRIVASPGAGSASRAAAHSTAPPRSTGAGRAAAISSAARRRSIRAT